jgi:hypothetical protein
MSRKSIQEIDFFPNQDRQRKTTAQKNHLPIARCVCGYEILVVPDLKAMNLAINNHLTAHKKTLTDSAERLTEQVLIVASKITLPTFN